MFSASGTARARSFYTHERTRTTECTVFEHSHHKSIGGGRLRSWMRASRPGQPYSCLFFKTHQIGLLVCFCAFVRSRRRPEKWTRTCGTHEAVSGWPLCAFVLFLLYIFFNTRRRWRVMPRLPEEPEELFVPGPAFVTVDILTRHICSVSLRLCLGVPMERDKYVWLVQSRSRPEKWTRTQRADSRGSATPDPVS